MFDGNAYVNKLFASKAKLMEEFIEDNYRPESMTELGKTIEEYIREIEDHIGAEHRDISEDTPITIHTYLHQLIDYANNM